MFKVSPKMISLLLGGALLLSACSGGTKQETSNSAQADGASAIGKPVVVSSKIDTEGTLLGNIILLTLEANGIKTQDKLSLGGLPIVRKALISGEVDIVPEYTGNGAFMFSNGNEKSAEWKDLQNGYEKVKKLDYEANKLVWLTPAQANNTYALAVREDVAGPAHLKTMSDFGRWVANGGNVKMIASQEFTHLQGALPAFELTYGFKMKPEQMVIVSGGDTANTIKAASQQTNGVNTAMVYGTDGAIEPSNLRVMEDDKGTQVIYAPAPVIREEVLKAHPEIEVLLKPVFNSLNNEVLRGLNAKVQVNGEPSKAVALEYLKSKGLIK
ncbi:glycine betaine ABC transporter substrate-binding protein OsmF [Hydromonas duriensis]|uniref:Osmoprotectant transport system substrate-binding protein n=1 Tax=Hydromonas duriensis TaxID=1527608 RepID=A0A4R6YB55_9BURK|nr:ABC transporter substrate-binding protein [Hydromonas duriensis]TDR32798.1 osmoprotectant transport system substrate-binding protein [Hydromonas duriensis]